MTEDERRRILGDAIRPNDGLSGELPGTHDTDVVWPVAQDIVWVTGYFTADQLEAIAAHMRAHGG